MKRSQISSSPPVVLSVAGSDNSCGAGAQADLKVISAHGCYGQTAITCVVAEVPGAVSAIHAVPSAIVAKQMELSMQAFPVTAAKTGMLYSASTIRAVAKIFSQAGVPIIVDPVMVASSGDPLLKPEAVDAYKKFLFPLATMITPNMDELELLCGGARVKSFSDLCSLASGLSRRTGCAILAKGGHLGGLRARDALVLDDEIQELSAPFVGGRSKHGTGCAFSAAIASNLALGYPLTESVVRAKEYITTAIREGLHWKKTTALRHFPNLELPASREVA